MKICGVIEIYDNDIFVTIVTTNSTIHLPATGVHSITIQPVEADTSVINVIVDLDQV